METTERNPVKAILAITAILIWANVAIDVAQAKPIATRTVELTPNTIQTIGAPSLGKNTSRALVAGFVNGHRMLGLSDPRGVVLVGNGVAVLVTPKTVTVSSLGGSGHVAVTWSLTEHKPDRAPSHAGYAGVWSIFPDQTTFPNRPVVER
jgi:hypothetical protein